MNFSKIGPTILKKFFKTNFINFKYFNLNIKNTSYAGVSSYS